MSDEYCAAKILQNVTIQENGIIRDNSGRIIARLGENVPYAELDDGSVFSNFLKTLPQHFQAIWDKKKTFEIRKNDRDFKVGDKIVLMELSSNDNNFTGRQIEGVITYVSDYNQLNNHVVFSFDELRRSE